MNTKLRVVSSRSSAFVLLAAAAMAALVPSSGLAYQETQAAYQPEQRDAAGNLSVEASNIHVLVCNGAGENGGQFYIYEYLNRPGFRAILPPNWGSPLGGQDFGTYQEAASIACGVVAPPPPPVVAQCDISGQWQMALSWIATNWTFTAVGNNQYSAQEQGGGNATGTAVVSGTQMQLSWSTGGSAGTHALVLDPSCSRATGTNTYANQTSEAVTWTRM